MKDFKYIGKYTCECGRIFENSQAFNGHKSHCKVHQIAKHGDLSLLISTREKQTETLKKTNLRKRNELAVTKYELNEKELDKWVNEKHTCERCGIVMTKKFGSGRFCSSKCSHSRELTEESRNKISIKLTKNKKVVYSKCIVCGCTFELPKLANGKLSKRKTCSQKCLNKVNAINGSVAGLISSENQQKRSKNEIYFCELCENYFKNVKHNEPIFNGWDADIIIEDIKYAVLWNGVWHYKQISKSQSLSQVQTRDKIKLDQIKSCGYTPFIIKDLGKENKQFVEDQFDLFIKYLNS